MNVVNVETFSGLKVSSIIIQILLFSIGLPIQLKIISVCWKEQEGKTWYIHLINSAALIIHFFFTILFDTIAHVFPNLSSLIGEWFCYCILFIRFYGYMTIAFNSFLVAVMKYIFIVHDEKARLIDEEKLKKLFLIVAFSVPFTLATIASVTKDINGFSDLVTCFGVKEVVDEEYATWKKNLLKFFVCTHGWTDHDIEKKYYLYVFQQCLCGIRQCATMLINTNFPEAFLYCKIFNKMRR